MVRPMRDIDTIGPLIDYLKRNLNKGYKIDDLRWALISQGHSRVAIDKAVAYINEVQDTQKPKKPEPVVQPVIEMPVIQERESFWGKVKNWFS